MKATKKNFSFIISMMFSLSCVFAQTITSSPDVPGQPNGIGHTINPVIGDISFVNKFGYHPDATTDEKLRIRTHFDYVENLLRQKDVSNLSPELQKRRQHMIDLFHEYAVAGVYPRNYDFNDQRKPCFIDKDNTICAVGYLVEQTVGREVAEAINTSHKYDDVLAMNDVQVDNWITGTGLSKEEVAMIQPTYGGGFPPCWPNSAAPPPLECKGNKVWDCTFSCCTLQWECKCVPPSQATGNDIDPCNGKGNGNHGNGNNGMARNMAGLYTQFVLQYLQAIL